MTAMAGGLAAACSLLAAPSAQAASPQSLYMDNCSACHQATGKGVKGAFPALAASTLVQGDPTTLASTVLAGRAGMPAFNDDLGDADLSALLTYVRSAWGNKGKPITAAEVAAARARLNAARKPRHLQAH